MNTQSHRMTQGLLDTVEDLVKQTGEEAMLARKLRSDGFENTGADHSGILGQLEVINKHLKLVRSLLKQIDNDLTKDRN